MGHRAAIYCRISRDKAGAGVKVEDQERDCRALAERLGLTVDDQLVFTDNDLTAHRGKKARPGYQALLAAIRAGRVGAVLCTHADRLHRSVKELETYIDTCGDIPTYQVMAGPLDLATASGRRNARLAAVIAEGEVDQMIERMRAARLHKAGRGEWTGNKRPFGYEADGVTVRPSEAAALAWAAGQVLAGTSLRAIAAELNTRGVRTSSAGAWDSRTLGRVLLRARNAGLSVYRGEVVGKATWPPILDEATWRGVTAVLSDPARRANPGRPPRWLLVNLAHCGVCGALVISKARARPNLVYYTCSAAAHLSRKAADVDAFVEAVVVERLSRPDARELLTPDQRGADPTALHLRDAALAARLRELGRLAGQGAIEPLQLVEATAEIRTQREEITAQLAASSRGSVLAGVADANDPAAAWAGLDLSRKRAIIDVLMSVVILPARRGRRRGWRAGESYFDPASVRVEPKRG
jgi:site-specific DNA recombinase